jgi:hypothetical protein
MLQIPSSRIAAAMLVFLLICHCIGLFSTTAHDWRALRSLLPY